MGYHIKSESSSININKGDFEEARQRLNSLNSRHDLKYGMMTGPVAESDSDTLGVSNKWFSWMAYDYDVSCDSLESILEQLGFRVSKDASGNIANLDYPENKMGQEYLFLATLAPFVADGGFIKWVGEDGNTWGYYFEDGVMTVEGEAERISQLTDL